MKVLLQVEVLLESEFLLALKSRLQVEFVMKVKSVMELKFRMYSTDFAQIGLAIKLQLAPSNLKHL